MPRFAFIDIAASYTGASPASEALGGTQAAVCYIGGALARMGHHVSLINQNRTAGMFAGLESIPPEQLDDANLLSSYDALVINGRWTKKLVQTLRKKINARAIAPSGAERMANITNARAVATPLGGAERTARIYAWMHEAAFNDPWVLPLAEFDGFVFVSLWQRNINAPLIPHSARTAIIPNGIAPAFHNLFENSGIINAKTTPPIAVYAGGSKRGLFFLPEILPRLHAQFPDMTFEIYSDCNIDNDENAKTQMREKLLGLSGVTHVGAVSQAELPERFKRASYFLSPNTYPETFCICLAEAMAAGCVPIITARAALSGTANNFATLVPVPHADSTNFEKDGLDVAAFSNTAIQAIAAHEALSAAEKSAKLQNQIDYANTHYNWDKQAALWAKLFPAN